MPRSAAKAFLNHLKDTRQFKINLHPCPFSYEDWTLIFLSIAGRKFPEQIFRNEKLLDESSHITELGLELLGEKSVGCSPFIKCQTSETDDLVTVH